MRLQQQQNKFGCGLACVAMITSVPYREIRDDYIDLNGDPEFMYIKNKGLTVKNYGTNVTNLHEICELYGLRINKTETDFTSWDDLPDVAILAINYRTEIVSGMRRHCWHWVVWNRELDCVFDPFPYKTDNTWKKYKKRCSSCGKKHFIPPNIRTDYKRLRPVSYIRVYT